MKYSESRKYGTQDICITLAKKSCGMQEEEFKEVIKDDAHSSEDGDGRSRVMQHNRAPFLRVECW
jgi:hypothetical protein